VVRFATLLPQAFTSCLQQFKYEIMNSSSPVEREGQVNRFKQWLWIALIVIILRFVR